MSPSHPLAPEAEAERHDPAALRDFAGALFGAAGVEAAKAAVMAELLVEADLMGHTTHGLALVPRYLQELESGSMLGRGEPEVIADRGACVTWDGRRLPGLWLTARAIDLALERVADHGTVSVAIGNGHHQGCLAVYLRRATERGCILLIASSAPGVRTVVPHGGTKAALSPAPFAAGVPIGDDALLVDISASITTNNMAYRLADAGRHYDHPWLLDADGSPTDDPGALRRGGALLPAGGLDHGQKGYGWGLIAETLSQGLSGRGRADEPKGMINSSFIQVIDPNAFAGTAAFARQVGAIAEGCRASPPRIGSDPVRLPGEAGCGRRRAGMAGGVTLHQGITEAIIPWAEKLSVTLPAALPGTAR